MKYLAAMILTIGLALAVSAQEKTPAEKTGKSDRAALAASSLYVISAKAGGVNYVSGKVYNVDKSGKKTVLVKGDEIESGNTVMTEGSGRAEILLNPGSFLRLAGNSSFKFDSVSLEDMKLSMTAGSVIVEFIGVGDFYIPVKTPQSTFYLIKSGVYRIDAADGQDKLAVWKGKARLDKNDKTAVTLKGGQETVIADGQTAVQKFDRDIKGEFEDWSKERAKELAKANARLINRQVSRSLIYSFARDRWNSNSNANGLWIYDPSRGYSYLPFWYGVSSPYGYDINRTLFSYTLPNVIYNTVAPAYNNNNVSNQQNNPLAPTGNGGSTGGSTASPMPAPQPRTESRYTMKNDPEIMRPERAKGIERPIDQ